VRRRFGRVSSEQVDGDGGSRGGLWVPLVVCWGWGCVGRLGGWLFLVEHVCLWFGFDLYVV
jgi:hypothetical protein